MKPIAIIGLSCRLPKAQDVESFWQLLKNGVDAITEVPASRWPVDLFYDPKPASQGKMNTRYGGFIDNPERFDAEFFKISPREAERIDPQHRLLLELAWEALENAAIVPQSLAGSRTGVFIGISNSDYNRMINQDLDNLNAYNGVGTPLGIAASRISYFFDLKGPSLSIDTACSSSAVALHLASQSLQSGEANLCIVGGINLILSPESTIVFSQARMMSGDGRCKTFDRRADGYVRSEGGGIVILKRLEDAQRDGDRIEAIIRGTAINQDGLTNGITAPSGLSQQAVIRQALAKAALKPDDISYIEAHGTGTTLGDPIEVNALKALFMQNRPSDRPCWLASVKTNVGHLESASGITSLIKVILCLKNRQLPPHLHFQQLNPYISLDDTSFQIPTQLESWPNSPEPRRAGISSFSFGGTNCHIILEEAAVIKKNTTENFPNYQLLTLSAKNEQSLQELTYRYHKYLETNPDSSLADICHTANISRTHFEHRLAILTTSREQLQQQLNDYHQAKETNGLIQGTSKPKTNPKIVFLFTGQGSQYTGMGKQLYETEPVFRQTIDLCNQILEPLLDYSLREILFPTSAATIHLIDETAYTQPAIFALEYALVQLWQSWGITPSLVLGHSGGEYVAACVAGVFSLENGLKLSAHRGRLMSSLPRHGAMLAVMAKEEQVRQVIKNSDICIAAVNSPQNVVISGHRTSIETVAWLFEECGIKTTPLKVSHAFHSVLMEPMIADFAAIAENVVYSTPKIPIISNLTGQLIQEEIATPDYWCRHILAPVLFEKSLRTLAEEKYQIFLEIGAKPILTAMGRQIIESESVLWLSSLRPPQTERGQMLTSVAQLYVKGIASNWANISTGSTEQKLSLPTYPFHRQKFWVSPPPIINHFSNNKRKKSSSRPLLGQRLSLANSQEIRFNLPVNLTLFPFLQDHLVGQKIIVPAAFYLSIVLEASSNFLRNEQLILEDIIFQKPLIISTDLSYSLQIVFSLEAPNYYSFDIHSTEDEDDNIEVNWILNVTGRIGLYQEKKPENLLTSLVPIKDRDLNLSVQKQYANYQEKGLIYGKDFQAITGLGKKEKNIFATIEIPQSIPKNPEQYLIHPTVLDASFQVLGANFVDKDDSETYLPVAIKRLIFKQSAPSKFWTLAEIPETNNLNPELLTANLQLETDDQYLIAQITGLTCKKVNLNQQVQLLGKASKNQNQSLYQVQWLPSPQRTIQASDYQQKGEWWLIFADRAGLGQQVAEKIVNRGDKCYLIFAGDNYQQLSENNYQINPDNREQWQQLLNNLPLNSSNSLPQIIYLWELDNLDPKAREDLPREQIHSSINILNLVQSLLSQEFLLASQLWLVTRGSQIVESEKQSPCLSQASLWGIGRVITQEHPELNCHLLDLDADCPQDAVSNLLTEIWFPDQEKQVAYRQGQRYLARLSSYSPPSTEITHYPINSQASYLITGGCGGLGLTVAQWLGQRGAKQIILTGRSAKPNPAAQEAIASLQAQGVNVVVMAMDVSDRQQVAAVLTSINNSLPPLKGIIHAAGVLDDGMLKDLSPERMTRVIAPKIAGAWNLHQLSQQIPLDFFVCFSSMASLLGTIGQGNYAFANSFLDALTYYRRSLGLPSLTINWGAWDRVGMAIASQGKNQSWWQNWQGIELISPELGILIMESLMIANHPQVAVFPADWSKLVPHIPSDSLLSSFLAKVTNIAPLLANNALEWRTKLTGLSAEERRKVLREYLADLMAATLRIPTNSIDTHISIMSMGLDSLMAIELRNRLKTELAIDIPVTRFLEGISLEDLVQLIETQIEPEANKLQLLPFSEHNADSKSLESSPSWVEGEI